MLTLVTTTAQVAARVLRGPVGIRITVTGLLDGVKTEDVIEITKLNWPRFVALRARWIDDVNAGRLTDMDLYVDQPGDWAGYVW